MPYARWVVQAFTDPGGDEDYQQYDYASDVDSGCSDRECMESYAQTIAAQMAREKKSGRVFLMDAANGKQLAEWSVAPGVRDEPVRRTMQSEELGEAEQHLEAAELGTAAAEEELGHEAAADATETAAMESLEERAEEVADEAADAREHAEEVAAEARAEGDEATAEVAEESRVEANLAEASAEVAATEAEEMADEPEPQADAPPEVTHPWFKPRFRK